MKLRLDLLEQMTDQDILEEVLQKSARLASERLFASTSSRMSWSVICSSRSNLSFIAHNLNPIPDFAQGCSLERQGRRLVEGSWLRVEG